MHLIRAQTSTEVSRIEEIRCARSAHVPRVNFCGTQESTNLLISLVPAAGFEPATP